MAKIWLKIWLKVKENGTKKIKLAKMVAKEKEILVRTLNGVYISFKCLNYTEMTKAINCITALYIVLSYTEMTKAINVFTSL